MGISHLKKNDLADILFEILEGWENLKYFGVVLSIKGSRIKKWGGN